MAKERKRYSSVSHRISKTANFKFLVFHFTKKSDYEDNANDLPLVTIQRKLPFIQFLSGKPSKADMRNIFVSLFRTVDRCPCI